MTLLLQIALVSREMGRNGWTGLKPRLVFAARQEARTNKSGCPDVTRRHLRVLGQDRFYGSIPC